jgi:uncharacterized RDD family membrane protein YckC
MMNERINQQQENIIDPKFAGLGPRYLAYFIDLLIWNLASLILIILYVPLVKDVSSLVAFILYVFSISMFMSVFTIFTYAFLISRYGGNIGKLLTGLKIVDENFNMVSFKRAFFRSTVGYFVSSVLWGVGYLWISRNPQKQGWHDMMSDTFVIKISAKKTTMWMGLGISIILIGLNLVLLSGIFKPLISSESLKKDIEKVGGEFSSIFDRGRMSSNYKNEYKQKPIQRNYYKDYQINSTLNVDLYENY